MTQRDASSGSRTHNTLILSQHPLPVGIPRPLSATRQRRAVPWVGLEPTTCRSLADSLCQLGYQGEVMLSEAEHQGMREDLNLQSLSTPDLQSGPLPITVYSSRAGAQGAKGEVGIEPTR